MGLSSLLLQRTIKAGMGAYLEIDIPIVHILDLVINFQAVFNQGVLNRELELERVYCQ